MLTLEDLIAIEEIKQLKARYFRAVDTMDLAGWLESFTDDAALAFDLSVRTSGDQDMAVARFSGRSEIENWWNSTLSRKQTVHHGHMPEITVQSPDRASGIWAMEDIVEFTDGLLWGYGHYHETYRREDGRWKIASLHLTRTRVSHTKRDTSFL